MLTNNPYPTYIIDLGDVVAGQTIAKSFSVANLIGASNYIETLIGAFYLYNFGDGAGFGLSGPFQRNFAVDVGATAVLGSLTFNAAGMGTCIKQATAAAFTTSGFYGLDYAPREYFSFLLRANVIAAAAVPEPATWGLMIAGFGMIGGAMRRRTAQAA